MRKLLMLLLILCSFTIAQDITWTEITSTYTLPSGIKIFRGERISPKLLVHYIDVDMNNPDLVIHPYISSTNLTINNFVPQVGAYAGVNGGFFGGSTSYSAVVYPYEVKAQNVPTLVRNAQSYPVIRSLFGMNFNRSFSVEWIYHFSNSVSDIYKFDAPLPYTNNQTTPLPSPQQSSGAVYSNLLVGMGGAPTLVKNGQVNITYDQEIMWGSGVGYDNRDPRTAVGYTADKHVIMLTADGRQTLSEGVGLPELAQLMINIGCVEAMNLDGGGSTQMAVGSQYVNSPAGFREIPTILTVTHKDSLKLPATPYYEKVIDTGDEEASLIGEGWFASANSGYWGTTPAQLNPIGNGSSYAEFRPRFTTDAVYEVYGWWVASSNRSQDTPFIIYHKNGTDTVRVNQAADGSMWKLIGTYQFSSDTTQKIQISNAGTTGNYVVADAIRLLSYDPLTSADENYTAQPSMFYLFQNYPNPFNPSTVIKYSLPANEFITLKIYDILGREIAILIEEEKPAGRYQTNFNASNLSGGVYFYQLKSASYSQTRKMILMR
jgi:hypothetical protein